MFMNTTMAIPRLVRVASFVNSAQAELARMQLAMEDIPAYLGNAALVTWFWHYSNATGGARVYVSAADADRAVAVLRPSREEIPTTPPWECGKCGEHIDGQWKTCWRCGTSLDGQEDANFFDEPPLVPLKFSARAWALIVGGSGPLVLLLSRGSLPLLLEWCGVVALMLALKSLWPAGEDGSEPAPSAADLAAIDAAAEAAEPAAREGYAVIEETALRAWQASVLSMSFPPLALYAVWLLLRLSLSEERLKPRELRRCVGAWMFSFFEFTVFVWLPYFLR